MKPLQYAARVTWAVLPLIYMVTYIVLTGAFTSEVKALVVGVVMTTTLGTIVGFWFQSSSGSQQKDQRNEPPPPAG